MQNKFSLLAVVLLACSLALLLAILPARAAAPRVEAGSPAYSPASSGFTVTFWVNTSQDLNDYDPTDNACTTDAFGTPCSLRAAVQQANTLDWPYGDPDAVAIMLPAGRYTLTNTGEGALG